MKRFICLLLAVLLVPIYASAEENMLTKETDYVLVDLERDGYESAKPENVETLESYDGRDNVIKCDTSGSFKLYKGFEDRISKKKIKLTFSYFTEGYTGYPNFYLLSGNVIPFDANAWQNIPLYWSNSKGYITSYGGVGSDGNPSWDEASGKVYRESGKWIDADILFDLSEGVIRQWVDGEFLCELKGPSMINGIAFQLSTGGSASKIYFDNVKITEINAEGMTAEYVSGTKDGIEVAFSESVVAEDVDNITVIDLETLNEAKVLSAENTAGRNVLYKIDNIKPMAEYKIIFGEGNKGEFGNGLKAGQEIIGNSGIDNENPLYGKIIKEEKILLQDDFSAYTGVSSAGGEDTFSSGGKWSQSASGGKWWNHGVWINKSGQIVIDNGQTETNQKVTLSGHYDDASSGALNMQFDIAYEETEDFEAEQNGFLTFSLGTVAANSPVFKMLPTGAEVYTDLNTSVSAINISKTNSADDFKTVKLNIDMKSKSASLDIGGTVHKWADGTFDIDKANIITFVLENPRNKTEAVNTVVIDNVSIKNETTRIEAYPFIKNVRFISEGNAYVSGNKVNPLTNSITVTFTKPMDEGTFSGITLKSAEGDDVDFSISDDGNNAYTLNLSETLNINTDYYLNIPESVKDSLGNKIVNEYNGCFKTTNNSLEVNVGYLNNALTDKEEFAKILSYDKTGLRIDNELAEKADMVKVAEYILDYQNGKPLEADDKTVRLIEKALMIECANNNRVNDLWIGDIGRGIDDIKLSEIIEARFSAEVTERMSGNDIKDIEEFDRKLEKAIVLSGIEYADGTDKIKGILTDYANLIGISSSDITDGIVDRIADHEGFLDLDDLRQFIKSPATQKPDINHRPNNNSGGGGGGYVSPSTDKAGQFAGGLGFEAENNTDEDYEQTEKPSVFNDLTEYGWAIEAIEKLYGMGVINGRGDKLFYPGEKVLREEIAKIIVEAFKLYIKGDISFNDVGVDSWYYPYVSRAYNAGIIKGISENMFGSNTNVTREDMAVMIYNALYAARIELPDIDNSGFADADEISDYAQKPVAALRQLGIFEGDEFGLFNPKSSATRAEAAKVVYTALGYLN